MENTVSTVYFNVCLVAEHFKVSDRELMSIRVTIMIRRSSRSFDAKKAESYPHGVVLEAIVESAAITWIGLFLFGVTSLAPQGRITVRWHVRLLDTANYVAYHRHTRTLVW